MILQSIKKKLKSILQFWHLDLRRKKPTLNYSEVFEIDMILDVGCNFGQFTDEMLEVFPNADYILFDAIDECISKCKRKYAKNVNIIVTDPMIITNNRGNQNFYYSENIHSSSIIEPTRKLIAHTDNSRVKRIINVEANTLDHFMKENDITISNYCFLKIDVNGNEVETIKGALNTLNKVKYVKLEACVQPVYENVKNIETLISLMSSLNFSILHLEEGLTDNNGQLLTCDLFFEKI
jgi:FkbM family methyltransferase